ncbi:MAG TPA: tryptophan--tRNA ligase [Dehalococcoidia bacterium]|nr:tryptophan--tRNA ligase [Dehalococcoidia bacterium]
MSDRRRILTGIRPTGPLHLGHYAGALQQWLALQDEYECFFLIADYQVSDYVDDIDHVRRSVWEVALDWLAVGLDPERNHFVIESQVPQHAELTALLSWYLPMGPLRKNPTLKSEMDVLEQTKKSVPVGFFIYPLMQIANILLPRADLVPVGDDQLPHIELTRDVASRFNRETGAEVFPLPKGRVGAVPRLVGLDGDAKMSKSRGNAINLKDDAETVNKRVMSMYTDPTRLRATDPGHVEGNPVFMYHDAFNPDIGEVNDLKERYTQGKVGDVEVKKKLAVAINNLLDPIRERRAHFEAHPEQVQAALEKGSKVAYQVAEETMRDVRAALKLNYFERGMPALEGNGS